MHILWFWDESHTLWACFTALLFWLLWDLVMANDSVVCQRQLGRIVSHGFSSEALSSNLTAVISNGVWYFVSHWVSPEALNPNLTAVIVNEFDTYASDIDVFRRSNRVPIQRVLHPRWCCPFCMCIRIHRQPLLLGQPLHLWCEHT